MDLFWKSLFGGNALVDMTGRLQFSTIELASFNPALWSLLRPCCTFETVRNLTKVAGCTMRDIDLSCVKQASRFLKKGSTSTFDIGSIQVDADGTTVRESAWVWKSDGSIDMRRCFRGGCDADAAVSSDTELISLALEAFDKADDAMIRIRIALWWPMKGILTGAMSFSFPLVYRSRALRFEFFYQVDSIDVSDRFPAVVSYSRRHQVVFATANIQRTYHLQRYSPAEHP